MQDMKVQRTELGFGSVNLKRHLGLPYSYCLDDLDWWGCWMDHYKLERVQRDSDAIHQSYVQLVAEPYDVSLGDMKQIITLCEKYNLTAGIGGNAEHNSACCRITIYRKYW